MRSGALRGSSVPEEYDRAVQTPAERQIVMATEGSMRESHSTANRIAGALIGSVSSAVLDRTDRPVGVVPVLD